MENAGLPPSASLVPFAFDEDFGYVCERLCDFGSGLSIGALLHLPALGQAGQLDRALRSLLAHGLEVEGYYGAEGGSTGDLYRVSTVDSQDQDAAAMAADFAMVMGRMVLAERSARETLLSGRREELLDRAGRALGLLQNCRFLGVAEGAAALSALRLATLVGLTEGIDAATVGARLRTLGPAAIAFASPDGAAAAASARRFEESSRARLLAGLVAGSVIVDGGHRCSRD